MNTSTNKRSRTTIITAASSFTLLAGLGITAAALAAQTPPATETPTAAAAPVQADVTTAAKALIGKPAPGFSLPDQNDKAHTLTDNKGKWTVLAFYPADMTKGCTFQNVSYSNNIDKFAPLNAVVYTVSTQDTASKKAFCSKEGLKHTLLADVGGSVAKQYGVLSGSVARRYTFYIAPDGTVADVDTGTNGRGVGTTHAAEDSLARLAKLQSTAPKSGTVNSAEFRSTVDRKVVVTDEKPQTFIGAASQKAVVGTPMPDFVLTDVTSGKSAGFTTISAGKKATVMVFVSTQCPVSNAYNERMEQIASAYAPKGVQFVGINANATEPTATVAEHAKTNGFMFPVYKDAGNKVADQFNAHVTPEVFIADEKGVLVYHGPIDDSQNPSGVTKHYTTAALDALLAGKPAPAADKRAFGCSIKRAE